MAWEIGLNRTLEPPQIHSRSSMDVPSLVTLHWSLRGRTAARWKPFERLGSYLPAASSGTPRSSRLALLPLVTLLKKGSEGANERAAYSLGSLASRSEERSAQVANAGVRWLLLGGVPGPPPQGGLGTAPSNTRRVHNGVESGGIKLQIAKFAKIAWQCS